MKDSSLFILAVVGQTKIHHVRLSGLILCSTCDRKLIIYPPSQEEVSKVSGASVGSSLSTELII
jgi:hypothetical protein